MARDIQGNPPQSNPLTEPPNHGLNPAPRAELMPELSFLLPPIRKASQSQFNGNLLLSWGNVAPWGLSFRHGRLIWAWAGNHRLRRWRCLVGTATDQRAVQSPPQGFASTQPVWEYATLKMLVSQGQLQRSAAQAIARQTLEEVIFDLVQMLYIKGDIPRLQSEACKLEQPLKFFAPSEVCMAVHNQWGNWCNAALQNYSPMLAPRIYQAEQLKALMSERSYGNLEQKLQGNLSLRELASQLNHNLLDLSQTLVSYERRHLIKFVPLPQPLRSDVQAVAAPQAPPSQPPVTLGQAPAAPLVLCIDDSELTCQQLGKVVESSGYRYISVQNPLEAVPRVLETKPSLIFLDLVMPMISGYELCAQLRRISELRDLPIIILTSSDKMIDRLRLKLAGSTVFLNKPISSSAVQRILQSYCQASAA